MGPEIQFETLAQDFVIDRADGALPGRAGIGDHDIDAAESRHHLVEGRFHAGRIGDVAGHRQRLAADFLGHGFRRLQIAVQDRDFRALPGHRLRRRRPDAGAAAGDHRHLPRQRFFVRLAQLGLFQRPIFDFEHVVFADAFVLADRLGIARSRRWHSRRCRRRWPRPWRCRRCRTCPRPAPGSRAARDPVPSSSPGSWRCCGRNNRDSAPRRRPSRRAPRPPIRPAARVRRGHDHAASSWCGWCGQASTTPCWL